MAAAGGEDAASAASAVDLALAPLPSEEAALAVLAAAGDSASLASTRAPEGADMMARFEALSKMFKCEVEGLLGSQKETAMEDLDRLEKRNAQLEEQVRSLRAEAAQAVDSIRLFMVEQQGDQLERVFRQQDEGPLDSAAEKTGATELSEGRLQQVLKAFLEVNGADERPELREAREQVAALRARGEADFAELARLRSELAEARQLKSQEERELAEFTALREKESELQAATMEAQRLRLEADEASAQSRQLASRVDQQQASLKERSDKIVDLVRRLEQQAEQVRLQSDENNTLRLELGRDVEYSKVAPAPTDPLSYTCAAGKLSPELQEEEHRLQEELRQQASKFPGLGGGNCRRWCQVQIGRTSGLHRSFLHRLQDHKEVFPEGVRLELVSQVQEAGDEWTQQEEVMRDADAAYQEAEKQHTKGWEEHRLKLTAERDAKVKQLLEQAEKSQSKAEQQLLLHQAKLYGTRVDAQVERAWEEQRKERDIRWKEHQQRKTETRQKLKEDCLCVRQGAEEKASASNRFVDLAAGKLAGVEDAWLRNSDKASLVSVASLKGADLTAALRSAGGGEDEPRLPARGAQHTGIGQALDAIDEALRARADARSELRSELEDQSLQQLRSGVEKFVLREAGDAPQAAPDAAEDGGELPTPSAAQANAIASLLRMRQHRHLSDTLRRQFQDYLLVLRLSCQAALWLLPPAAAQALAGPSHRGAGQGASLDLPPPPAELREAGAVTPSPAESEGEGAKEGSDGESLQDTAAEAGSLYDSMCHRILDRALTNMGSMHREELLGLKQAYASEVRLALQSLCQLEGSAVDAAVKQDLQEFELQTSARLLADCELGVSEERRRLSSQIASEVEARSAVYRRRLEDEEQAVLRDRRKWLTERLVVMQANGAVGPADRTLLKRLRQELRACEAKIEIHENQRVDEAKARSSPKGSSIGAQAPLSARPPSGERSARRSRPSSASKSGRRPSRDSSWRSPSGTPEPPAQLLPAAPAQSNLPPRLQRPEAARYSQIDPDMLCSEGPSFARLQESPPQPVAASPRQLLPQFGDGASLFRDTRETPELGLPGLGAAPPDRHLYDWPFEPAGPGDAAAGGSTPRSARGPPMQAAPQKLKPLDAASKIAFKGAEAEFCGEAAGGWPPRVGAPRQRSGPPLLPPVHTPRG